jgi:hypothetical protein
VWERNSLSISLQSSKVLWQKINYIYQNPVKAGLCKYAEDYYYANASFIYIAKMDRYACGCLLVKNTKGIALSRVFTDTISEAAREKAT